MSFGKQMRLRREELHLSRAALAEELGVSPSAISNYENGVSSPKEEVLLRLFDEFESVRCAKIEVKDPGPKYTRILKARARSRI